MYFPHRDLYVDGCQRAYGVRRWTAAKQRGRRVYPLTVPMLLPRKRSECRSKAKEYMSMGQIDLAKKKMAEAFDISPDVAYRLILAMKEKKLPFIVAPYEADAQLAYLSRYNFVDVVITEDSDLLAFGAKSVLYKFDYRDYMGD
jgi:hypothetical protein